MGICFSGDVPPHFPQKACVLALMPPRHKKGEPKVCRVHMSSAFLEKIINQAVLGLESFDQLDKCYSQMWNVFEYEMWDESRIYHTCNRLNEYNLYLQGNVNSSTMAILKFSFWAEYYNVLNQDSARTLDKTRKISTVCKDLWRNWFELGDCRLYLGVRQIRIPSQTFPYS